VFPRCRRPLNAEAPRGGGGAEGVSRVPSLLISAMQVSVERGRRGGVECAEGVPCVPSFRVSAMQMPVEFKRSELRPRGDGCALPSADHPHAPDDGGCELTAVILVVSRLACGLQEVISPAATPTPTGDP